MSALIIVSNFVIFDPEIKVIGFKVLNTDYGNLISALASFCAVLAALYYGSWREMLRKPKLKLYFNENKLYPYFHNLSFGIFDTGIEMNGLKVVIHKPGINVRVKVANEGKSTGNKVQARIEKIEFINQNNVLESTTYYHPTRGPENLHGIPST